MEDLLGNFRDFANAPINCNYRDAETAQVMYFWNRLTPAAFQQSVQLNLQEWVKDKSSDFHFFNETLFHVSGRINRQTTGYGALKIPISMEDR